MSKKDTIRVFSVDPGLGKLGWSLIEYDSNTGVKTVLRFGTVIGDQIIKQRREMYGYYDKRFIILTVLEEEAKRMMEEMSPDYIAIENAFVHKFPSAYAALVLVIHTIRRAAYQVLNKTIYPIAPKESKKAISSSGTADKQKVQDSIINREDISFKESKQNDLTNLTEHSADAIACGVAFIDIILPTVLAQEAIKIEESDKK